LAGIDSATPGYQRIRIHPHVPVLPPLDQGTPPLTWVKARYDSIRGPIRVDWQREHQQFRMTVTIPANTTASVTVPADGMDSVKIDQRPAADLLDVQRVRLADGTLVFEIGSGTYEIESRLPIGKQTSLEIGR
ncbi:MAG: hypothetical protein JJ992_28645, partial [Planctomycetes bacterium]|nr:hypothetical protein [Planctomycetota bacterium]